MRASWLLLFVLLALPAPSFAQDTPDPAAAVTADSPEIAPSLLKVLVRPLSVSQLEDELARWQQLVQETDTALGDTQLQLRKIAAMAAAEETGEEPDPSLMVGPIVDQADEEALTQRAGELLAERSARLERLQVVINDYAGKGGDPDLYRRYVNSVSGLDVNWTDPGAVVKTLHAWALSAEGGQAVLRRVGVFAAVIAGAYAVGLVVSWVFAFGFRAVNVGSRLLRRFVIRWSRRIIFFVGALIGLSALGVDVTPLVAALGAAGFIVGFALQGTLSNFASGMLIMTQRPFDVGDVVDVAGINGVVEEVHLFNTKINTFDNKKMIVPNNNIWNSIITNATASDERRLDLEIDIIDTVPVEEAEKALTEVIGAHAKVLPEPAAVVKFDGIVPASAFGATTDPHSWKRFVCRCWAKTDELYPLRWDLIRDLERKLGEGTIRRVA